MEEVEDQAERPYIEASKPILEAIAKRDYEKLYTMMSSHAFAKIDSDQFGPVFDAQGNAKKSETILNMTKEQFLEMMGEMEKRLAVPKEVDHLYVQTIDPNELDRTSR